MGVVYLAHDLEIERQVAIKTIRAEEAGGLTREETQNRFLREAKLAGRLQHPNIVTIYEVGRDGEVFFIAMEYVDGWPLTKYLGERGTLSLAERVEIARQAAQALQHAHERGVVHRDVKPGNILLTREGRVKVADFGIGKLLAAGATDLTRTGQLVGSPAYMSPEQIRGQKLDGRSDFFSLGVVFFELLTGSRPFPGDSITTLVYQILHTEHRDPLELQADLPAATREVFARLLAKQPTDRPADAREFIAEIRRIESKLRESEPTQRIVLAPLVVPVAQAATASPPPVGTVPVAEETLPAEGAVLSSPRPPAQAASQSGGLPAAMASQTAPGERSAVGPGYLYGLAAVIIAAAVLLGIWRYTSRDGREASAASGGPSPPARATTAPLSTAPSFTEVPPASLVASATPAVTIVEGLPTPGPASAADAIVGAPRDTAPARPTAAPRVATDAPRIAEARPADSEAPPPSSSLPREQPAMSLPAPSVSDNVYRTKRFLRFGVSPDQARVYVDGRYVGIADDWDDSGGGRDLEFPREGSHRVRLELPGYRSLNLDVLVTSAAEEDTAEIDEELQRTSRDPYPKFSSPSEQTIGPVVFEVEPPNALVTEGGRALGPASSFGPSSPLRLSGPAVHDFVLSAPGRKSKTVRILVAANAEEEIATVKVKLKEE
jgi:serine/threonine-protein kinase